LVVGPVYDSERAELEPLDPRRDGDGIDPARAVRALAAELKIPPRLALDLYGRLRGRVKAGEAAAVALFAAAKRSGAYVSLAKACEMLNRCGVEVEHARAIRALLACAPLVRPTAEEALEVYARKLNLSEDARRRALEVLRAVKPYAGGRDPYIVALAAVYLASGTFSVYGLARAVGRSPGRLHENVRYLQTVLARRVGGAR